MFKYGRWQVHLTKWIPWPLTKKGLATDIITHVDVTLESLRLVLGRLNRVCRVTAKD